MVKNGVFALCSFALMVFVLGGTVNAQKFAVGSTVENFSLTDLDGKSRSFNDLRGEKGTVLVFLSGQCPVVKQYNDRLNQIAADYTSRGFAFVGINSNATESLEYVKTEADKAGYKFPTLIDTGNVIADKVGASVTPEIFLFDTKNVLIYHGAIDNDKYGKNITDNYLKAAFDATLMGKKIERTSAAATGCSIKRKKAE